MIKKIFVSAAAVFAAGIFCLAYSQSHEAVIKLDSSEDIEKFQKILNDDGSKNSSNDLETALVGDTKNGKKTEILETEFKVFIPQAKEDGVNEASGKSSGNVKWLESDEDIAEFNEIIKKAADSSAR
ncbi:MAG: hypothetical protein FWH43_01720 [Endomicrobia bacterium]|nr:hypothetical protein [Endomicrobiia bacterium]